MSTKINNSSKTNHALNNTETVANIQFNNQGLDSSSSEGDRSEIHVNHGSANRKKHENEINSIQEEFKEDSLEICRSSNPSPENPPVNPPVKEGSSTSTSKLNSSNRLTPLLPQRSASVGPTCVNLSGHSNGSGGSPVFLDSPREASKSSYLPTEPINGESPLSLPFLLTNGHEMVPDNISRSSESGRSFDSLYAQKTPDAPLRIDLVSVKSTKSGDKKKKPSSWYNMLNPNYKSRSDDFKRLFKDLPEAERLIVDYSCAMQKDILVQGRLYVSQNYVCFYANIFRWETLLMIRCRDIASMTKEKTARVIPNAIQICTNNEKHFFTSFGARDKTYLMLFRIWQNALLEQPMSSQELWQWVHFSYGEELGLTSDDDDYVAPPLPPPSANLEDDKNSDNLSSYMDPGVGMDSMSDKMDYSAPEGEGLVFDPRLDFVNGTSGVDSPIIPKRISKAKKEGIILKNKNISLGDYPPTDMSDTTESDMPAETGGEVLCACESHEGKEVLNVVIPIAIDQLFTLTFTLSKFMMELMESRKTFDVMETAWQPCDESGNKLRQLTYTLTLNHSMAKTAQTTDNQSLLKHSKPGQVYIVDCDIVNTGVPYSDTFSVKSIYCLTRVSSQETRLRVHGLVRYKKSVWGLVKSLIEKTAMQGLTDFCTDLESALRKEAERICQPHAGKKSRRRKRTKALDMKSDITKDAAKTIQNQNSIRKIVAPVMNGLEISSAGPTSDLVIRVILATLVALLLLNGLLFYKLWSLEDQSLQLSSIPVDFELPNANPSSEGLVRLLRQQEILHRTEAEKWKEAISDVIKLIRLMESSLSELKFNIESYSKTALLKSSVTIATGTPVGSLSPASESQYPPTRIVKE